MKHFQYQTCGTCSRLIDFDLDDVGRIHNLSFLGGCHGNLQGIARMAEGRDAAAVSECLQGVDCHGKGTSCPDQLAHALKLALQQVC